MSAAAHPRPAAGGAPIRERRRIALVTDIVTPYVVAVLKALADSADLRVLFCSRTGTRGMGWQIDVPFPHEVIEGLTIRRRSPDATDFYLSPRTLAALLRARPEAIVSGGFSIPSLYAAICARAQRIPLLIQSDGTARSEAQLGISNDIARKLIRPLAWGAVANSGPAAERFAQLGFRRDRIFLAPHVTDMARFWAVGAGRRYGYARPLRLLVVGRLIPRKGVDWLLRASAGARAHGVDVDLTVVGSGSEERSLRELADALGLAVRWRGFVDQDGLPELYAEADAFAFPTLDDPFGIVVLEAAAAGLPVIASPHGGATGDFVRDGHNGIVVEPTDTAAMAAAIARLAGAPALRAALGAAAHAATLERSPAVSAAGYLAAVEAALADTGPRRAAAGRTDG